jgi:hypothetical protein
MPYQQIPGTSEQYALLCYDKRGRERSDDPDGVGGSLFKAIISQVEKLQPSHVFLFSHGWKGDIDAARDQYDRWVKALLDLKADQSAVPGTFKPIWIGLHWPSLPFGDEEFGGADFSADTAPLSPQRLKATYMDRLDVGDDAAPLLDTIILSYQKNAAATELPAQAVDAYRKLAEKMRYQEDGPSGHPDAARCAFDPQQAFQRGTEASAGASFETGGILAGVLSPLRQLSYWTMKQRARAIGESGMHDFIATLMKAAPQARFHLMGHSFGTIVVSGILGGRDGKDPLPRKVDSVALVQGAVSLWAFGDQVHGKSLKGYFNPVIHRPSVRGPVIVTRSIYDRAVGILYPWASAASFNDGAFDADEEDLPLYGAIGKFGIRALPNVEFRDMLDQNGLYKFKPGWIYNIQSSQYIRHGGGVSGAHSDIAGPEVAHAMWQAALV